MDLKQYSKDVLFLPMGGAGEIGMNLNLYHQDGKWLIVDLGIGFANGTIPGVDVVVPDIEFLQTIKKDIVGIVITHGHEDHFGAVQYLWEYLPLPIYTSKFTAEFLRTKLKEFDFSDQVKINEIALESKFSVGTFDLEFVEINHSIPEMNALIFHSNEGKIFHTGDWKFDKNPVLGKPDDYTRFKEIGDSGIKAFICDSTNIMSEGHSGSEGDLQESLIKIISEQKNLTVVSCFASNVGRLITIIKAVRALRKKMVICGRSLQRIIQVAQATGYVDELPEIIDIADVAKYKREDLLLLATGCQGEERAALTRLANGSHPYIKLHKGDSVILSSKIIPGNERKIIPLFNLLARKEVSLITERDHFVHVSGHPNRDELTKMYELIRPEISIPVHGESFHLYAHMKFAKEMGVKSSHYITNGDCFRICGNKAEKVFEVKAGIMAIDGNSIVKIDNVILKQRKKMAENGVVMVSLMTSGRAINQVRIKAPGLFANVEDREIIEHLEGVILQKFGDLSTLKNKKQPQNQKRKGSFNKEHLQNEIRSVLRKIIRTSLRKEPYIEIFVNEL